MTTDKQEWAAPVLYEIRKCGVTYCQSYLENCGYSSQTIRGMVAAGYELYANGKKVPRGRNK